MLSKITGIVLVSFLIASGFAVSANAATTTHLSTLFTNEDQYYNYDFLSQSAWGGNVDWPVTMVFCNNADVNKVKSIYFGSTIASTMYLQMNDGGGWVWDSDMGTKGALWYSSYLGQYVYLHMRVYAPNPPDYAYNSSWGNYVLGTTHYDQYPFETWSGYSEDAEKDFASIALSKGYTVIPDTLYFYNNEPYRVEGGNHYWQNDGYATRVCIP